MPGRTTRTSLRRLLFALIATALVSFVACEWTFDHTRRTANEVRLHSAPSILHVMAARAAVIEADAAAVTSFGTGAARLTGPGQRYQNQIAVASQSLTRLAEDSAAGASQSIQLVEGLLVAYVGLIEQADAHFRQDNGSVLAAADLWYASRLLHMPDGGVLAQLDQLLQFESRALAAKVSTGWLAPQTLLAWLVPLTVLALMLVAGQVFLGFRFRRILNLPLIGATLAVLILFSGMSYELGARRDLAGARDAATHAADVWQERIGHADDRGQRELGKLVSGNCRPAGGCGDGVAAFTAQHDIIGLTTEDPNDLPLREAVGNLNRYTAAAADTTTPQLVVTLAALLALLLVPAGLYPRLAEYR